MLYLDSSAVVKRYVAEPGSALVRTAIAADPSVATAIVTHVEVRAALAAAQRARRFRSVAAGRRVAAAFRQEWARDYVVVTIDAALCESAGDLGERHALRGYDAIQLAAALRAAEAQAVRIRFGTFDDDLRDAARAEGLATAF